MDRHEGNDAIRPSFAERRSVRQAIAAGRPVYDPRLKPYALQRLKRAKSKFQGLQSGSGASPRRRNLTSILIAVIGLFVLLSGLSPPNTVKIVIGAVDLGLGVAFLLLQAIVNRSLSRLIDVTSRAERIQAGNAEQ